jgi:hypothetical protein
MPTDPPLFACIIAVNQVTLYGADPEGLSCLEPASYLARFQVKSEKRATTKQQGLVMTMGVLAGLIQAFC